MIKKINILVSQYFTERDYERYGIDLLIGNDFKVEVWDLSLIIYPETINALKKTFKVIDRECIRRFKSKDEVIKSINREENTTYFISTILLSIKTFYIFKAIGKNGCDYGCTGTYTKHSFPMSKNINLVSHRRGRKLFYLIPNVIYHKLNHIVLKYLIKFFSVKSADYFALAGGNEAMAVGPLISDKTNIQHIHASDYDIYLKTKNKPTTATNGNYIVFIDQYLPFHPDMQISKQSFYLDPNIYYKGLRKIFDSIEKKTNYHVVIAAHPKASYKENQDYFGGRKIIYGFNSSAIISRAKLVILHYSTAINYSIIYRKPILFVTSDELIKSGLGRYVDNLAQYFSSDVVNVSDNILIYDIPKINSNIYDGYMRKYIKKSGTIDRLFWQQFADYIKAKK